MYYNMNNLNILVSGQNGPLGRALVSLDLANTKMIGFRSRDCNLLDAEATTTFFRAFSEKYSKRQLAYFHVAALSGGSHLSERIPATLFKENIIMAINALDAARESGINRVLMVLSTACYSSKLNNPKEEELHDLPVDTLEFGYAYAKRMFDVLMRAYNKQHNMNISCVLVNGIIGPGMHFGDDRSILPAALIKKFHKEASHLNKISLWGDGSPIREYTFSSDLAQAMVWCVRNQAKDTILNIGNSEKISVRELAKLIGVKMGIDLSRLHFTGSSNSGRQMQSTNNTKFMSMSDFKYSPLEYAIDSAIRYYVSDVAEK